MAFRDDSGGLMLRQEQTTNNSTPITENNSQFNIFDWDGDGECFELFRGNNTQNTNSSNSNNTNNITSNQPYQLSQQVGTNANVLSQRNYCTPISNYIKPDIDISAEAFEEATKEMNLAQACSKDIKQTYSEVESLPDLDENDRQILLSCNNTLNQVELHMRDYNQSTSIIKNIINQHDPSFGNNDTISTQDVENVDDSFNIQSLFDWDGDGESFEWLKGFDKTNQVKTANLETTIKTEIPKVVEETESVEETKAKDVTEWPGYVETLTVNEEYNYSSYLFEDENGYQYIVDAKGEIDEDSIVITVEHGGSEADLFNTGKGAYAAFEDGWLNREFEGEHGVVTIRWDRKEHNKNMTDGAKLAVQITSECNIPPENIKVIGFSAGYSSAIKSTAYLYERFPDLTNVSLYMIHTFDNTETDFEKYGEPYRVSDEELQLLGEKNTVVFVNQPNKNASTDYNDWPKMGMQVIQICNTEVNAHNSDEKKHHALEKAFYQAGDLMDIATNTGVIQNYNVSGLTNHFKYYTWDNGWQELSNEILDGKTELEAIENTRKEQVIHLEQIPENEQPGQL